MTTICGILNLGMIDYVFKKVKATTLAPKRQGSLCNVGIMGFVFTNFQTNNYGTSSGDDEGNCVYN